MKTKITALLGIVLSFWATFRFKKAIAPVLFVIIWQLSPNHAIWFALAIMLVMMKSDNKSESSNASAYQAGFDTGYVHGAKDIAGKAKQVQELGATISYEYGARFFKLMAMKDAYSKNDAIVVYTLDSENGTAEDRIQENTAKINAWKKPAQQSQQQQKPPQQQQSGQQPHQKREDRPQNSQFNGFKGDNTQTPKN